ncbi:MAG: helix-turn-helix domain-containing protein [Candidatus Aenigmarchaeota archaeon]|nr:helix-turn-helix domain-containing protein [Candidatus Aenigmarchaeota archaeon]
MPMRRGRQLYSKKYDEAMELHKEGKSINEIATSLGVSYSAAYHWIKGLRKPEPGNVNEFESYFRENGPMPAIEIEKKFQKHNELFLMSNKRGMKVRRKVLQRRFAGYATWYYMEGQEALLDKRLEELFSKIKDVREKLKDEMFK